MNKLIKKMEFSIDWSFAQNKQNTQPFAKQSTEEACFIYLNKKWNLNYSNLDIHENNVDGHFISLRTGKS